jgi:hypothetical protein
MGKGDDMSERNGLATRIGQATGIPPEKVCEVVQLALEELHHIMIVDEKGPTAAVMEACFSFGGDAAFHLIGLFVSEHDYHGRDDDAGIWSEVAKRFIPSAYAEGCARIAPWCREKTTDRLGLDADIRHSSTSMSKNDERDTDCSKPEEEQVALIDEPSHFDASQEWEQHLDSLRNLSNSTAINSHGELAKRGSEKSLEVIAGPSKIAGGISRVVSPDGGGLRVETWKPGVGWEAGGASLDEFMPGACTPVTPELAQRMGIPASELGEKPLRRKALVTALIDSPSPFDTLETWEQHLAMLRRMPDNTALKPEMISDAEQVIARKKRG